MCRTLCFNKKKEGENVILYKSLILDFSFVCVMCVKISMGVENKCVLNVWWVSHMRVIKKFRILKLIKDYIVWKEILL